MAHQLQFSSINVYCYTRNNPAQFRAAIGIGRLLRAAADRMRIAQTRRRES
jgi:hypothetical protein